MKNQEIYQNNPDVIAYFAIKDGNIIFDLNDKKISVSEMMVINTNLVNEYVKSIAQLQTDQQNKQE